MPIRVLLVDGVPEIRASIRAALAGRTGFEVVGEAENGAGAIAQAARLRPDIVVLDTGLPDLAGRHILSRLRTDAPAAKVVVFSGAAPEQGADIDGYAAKGGQLDYLVNLLESLGGDQTGPQMGPHMAVQLARRADSARHARDFTRKTLQTWQLTGCLDDALLIVSELVSNAVRHARSGCELRLLLGAAVLRIEVCDTGAGTPDPLPPSADRPFGRGLNLIDALTPAWGVDPLPGRGKVVWAELPQRRAR